MDDSTIAVILNPAAGGGKTLKALPKINVELQRLGRPFHIHLTKERGDATAAARRFADDNVGVILAVGGDGTINEVANGIVGASNIVPIGLIPAGHGSDFARTVETPKNIVEAIKVATNGRSRSIDAGLATFADGTSRVFVNVAGLGFDALVAQRAQSSRMPGTNLPYLSAALRTLATFKNIPTTLTFDDDVISTPAVFVQVANAKFMGGGFKIAPMADLSDGYLDLALVGDFRKTGLLRALPGVYGGKHVDNPKFTHRLIKEVRVETSRLANVQLDGELLGPAPVTFTVLPAALLFAG